MQVVVIGGGPAGSLAAILLARGGASVSLIERHRYPRHKVCGECLSALGRVVLARNGLETPLAENGVELVSARLHAAGASVAFDLPRPMLGISRAYLDLALLRAAGDAGAIIVQPARVEALNAAPAASVKVPEGEPPVVVTVRESETNTVRELHADIVVLANGAAIFAGDKPAATGDLGIKTHFRNVNADAGAITLYAAGGCYGGAAPIEDGRWNAAFSVPAERVRAAGGDVAAVFDALVQSDPAMRRAFASPTRIEPWLAAPLPRYAPRRDWPINMIPIGNAAAAIEPIGGEGMGLALRSAELAAEAILGGRLHLLQSQYEQLWRSRRIGCRLAALSMTRGQVASFAMGLLDSPQLAAAGLAMLGK